MASTARRTRTSAPASAVKTRKVSPKSARAGVKLGKPTPRKAAPKAAPKGKTAPKTTAGIRATGIVNDPAAIKKVRALRAKGVKWADVSAQTGIPLGTLARMRKSNGGREGFVA